MWLLPRCAHRTQYLLLTYLNDQQLPWPDASLPAPVREAVKAWHKLAEDHLETELVTAATEAGLASKANLKETKARSVGLALRGEIDLLAADPVRHRIWIIEAKHLRQAFSPLETGARIADFHGQAALATGPGIHKYRQFRSRNFRPYVQRVLSNTRAVLQSTDAAIRLMRRAESAQDLTTGVRDDWEVIPLLVTTHIDVSAFVTDPQVTFVQIDHLQALLTASQAPPPGPWVPWAGQTARTTGRVLTRVARSGVTPVVGSER